MVLEFKHRKHHLRLEAVERNEDDFIIEARVWVDHFTARSGCDLTLEQIKLWGTQLEALYETARGETELASQGFRVVIAGAGDGHMTVSGELDSYVGWGDGQRAILQFTLPPLDQTYLPPAIAWVEEVTEMEQATGGCRDE